MQILLHIGQSKTGTSAIQAYMTLNRVQLSEQGVLYPTVTIGGMRVDVGNHNSIADSLCGLIQFPYLTAGQYFKHIFAEAKRTAATRIVFSGEHFFGGEPRIWNVPDHAAFFAAYRQKVEALAIHLGKHDTKVLIYLRPQAEWLSSAISQTIRIQGLLSDQQIYQNDRQFFEMAKPVLCYGKLLDIWSEVLQPSSIEVVPYDRKMLIKGSAIADFLQRAGLRGLRLPYGNVNLEVNESLTRECIEVKKRFNLRQHSKSAERIAIRCLVQMSRKRGGATTYLLSPELLEDIRNFIEPENAVIESRFGTAAETLNALPNRTADPLELYAVEEVWSAFDATFRSASVRLMIIDDIIREFMRNNARPIHSFLHQFKMMRQRHRYKTPIHDVEEELF